MGKEAFAVTPAAAKLVLSVEVEPVFFKLKELMVDKLPLVEAVNVALALMVNKEVLVKLAALPDLMPISKEQGLELLKDPEVGQLRAVLVMLVVEAVEDKEMEGDEKESLEKSIPSKLLPLFG